jgi:hypothetical protein
MTRPLSSEVEERLRILQRICARGRNYFLMIDNSKGIDMFEHMEQEVYRLELCLKKET